MYNVIELKTMYKDTMKLLSIHLPLLGSGFWNLNIFEWIKTRSNHWCMVHEVLRMCCIYSTTNIYEIQMMKQCIHILSNFEFLKKNHMTQPILHCFQNISITIRRFFRLLPGVVHVGTSIATEFRQLRSWGLSKHPLGNVNRRIYIMGRS